MEESSPLIISCGVSQSLQLALKHRDEYTQFHCERVAKIAIKTGIKLGFNEQELCDIEKAAIFHDIGKIGMSDEILFNPGKLTDSQYEQMKAHPIIGASITEKLDIPNAEKVAKIIYHHHEHFSGSGYPDGLKGEKIPLGSRIICIIDVFDALTSNRRYRDPLSFEQTLAEMEKTMIHQFDPQLFEVISDVIRNEISPE